MLVVENFAVENLAVVRYVSDTIAVVYRGRIVEHGPAGTVPAEPQDPCTRELLASTEGRSR